MTDDPTPDHGASTEAAEAGAAEAGAAEPAYNQQRSSVGRNTRHLLLSQGATWSLATVLTVISPRIVGPEVVGTLSLAASYWGIAAILISFGMSNIITLDFARGHGTNAGLQKAVGLQVILYVISTAAIIGISLAVGYRGELLTIILLSALIPPFTMLVELSRWTFFGLEQVAWPATTDVIQKFATVALIVGVIVLGGRGIAITVANVLLAGLYYSLMVGGLRKRTGYSLRPSFTNLSPVVRRALPFVAIEATTVVYQKSDTIFISALSNETQVGWYSIAETFLGSLLLVPTLVVSVVFPAMARMSSQSIDDARRLVRRCLRLLWITTVPLGLGTVVIADRMALLLFGSDYSKSGPVLAAMGVVMIVMAPAIVIFNYGVVLGRQSRWTYIMIAAFLVSIPLHLTVDRWTNRQYGSAALGAAMVFTATEVLILVLSIIFIAPDVIDRSVISVFLRTNIAGGLLMAAAWPLREQMLLLPIIAGAAVYVLAVVVLRAVDDEEKRLILSIPGRLRRRG
jgi:O-antigen/teichoic acid export membrane protein